MTKGIEELLQRIKVAEGAEKDTLKKIKASSRANNEDVIKNFEQRLLKYRADYEYLQSIKTNHWIPIPEIRLETIESSVKNINKNIEKNTFTIKLNRFLNCKSNEYYIQWNISLPSGIYSDKSNVCDK